MLINWLTQIIIVSVMNLRNIGQRLGTSLVAIFGVACVVGVFIGVLSMAAGFQRTMTSATSDEECYELLKSLGLPFKEGR